MAHHQAGVLTQPVRLMESAWKGAFQEKLSIDSIIGLWCIAENFACRHFSSKDDRDILPGALKSVFHYVRG